MKKIILFVAILFLFIILAVLYIVTAKIYSSSFNYRCTTSLKDTFQLEDFPELKRERHEFLSQKGQKLVGYLYENAHGNVEEKGLLVFAHGLGAGGQVGYIDIFSFMAQKGYSVFAYDATENDESEGEMVGGLPQGIIDLDYAISYVQTIERVKKLPIVLMGFSWGGLSVGNVLNYHPEVKAAVTLAGWNKSMNLIEHKGREYAGNAIKLLLPFASVYEFTKYGKYAFSSAMKGFANTDAGIMIVHSEDDKTVSFEYGYGTYVDKYEGDTRFVFKRYTDRGHNLFRINKKELDELLFGEIADFYDSWIVK